MIEHFKRRRFEKAVLRKVESDLIEFHGQELGGECLGFCVTGILKAREIDGFPENYIDQLRKRGFTEADAALGFLDSSITALKRLLPPEGLSGDVARIIGAMERAVDHVFAANQGMLVPRNGAFGPMMDGFAKDIV